MTLGNLLTVDLILPEMKSAERWTAIVELVDLLVAQKQVKAPDRDVVLAALRQREETMSTGIGFGIAIPHASSDRVDKVVAAFGRSMSGIEFDSLDNAPVKFIVLFVVPKDQFQTHLRTLAAIAKFLNDRSVRERLGTAVSAAEILSIFEKDGGGIHVRPVRTKSPFEKYRGIGSPGIAHGKKAVVRWVRELRGR